MVAYSGLYFCIDTLVVSRAINWFVTPIRYRDILPVRASAYIISVFNEQIGKGAMAYYLNRRHRVPGWEVGSVMLFIMFCEVFYLLFWATVGYFAGPELPPAFGLVPWLAAAAVPVFAVWVLYFRGVVLPANRLRGQRIFHAFRTAELRHYALFLVLRSPALLAAVVVYTTALNLFGVDASFLALLGYLPVVFFAAAVPTPMRAAAITFWVVLFPENEGQMAAFRLRAAQLLHPVQRPHRRRLLAAGAARAVRLRAWVLLLCPFLLTGFVFTVGRRQGDDGMAHLLTGVRVGLALPLAVAFARRTSWPPASSPCSWPWPSPPTMRTGSSLAGGAPRRPAASSSTMARTASS